MVNVELGALIQYNASISAFTARCGTNDEIQISIIQYTSEQSFGRRAIIGRQYLRDVGISCCFVTWNMSSLIRPSHNRACGVNVLPPLKIHCETTHGLTPWQLGTPFSTPPPSLANNISHELQDIPQSSTGQQSELEISYIIFIIRFATTKIWKWQEISGCEYSIHPNQHAAILKTP